MDVDLVCVSGRSRGRYVCTHIGRSLKSIGSGRSTRETGWHSNKSKSEREGYHELTLASIRHGERKLNEQEEKTARSGDR